MASARGAARAHRVDAVIVDLHTHFPMRSTPRDWVGGGATALGDAALSALTGAFARLGSDRRPWSGRRVTLEGLRRGEVVVAFSVLYSAYHEFDPWGLVTRGYGCPGTARATEALLRQREMVERAVAGSPTGHVVARDWPTLNAAIDSGRPALVHCVEGGFHLGETPDEVRRAVRRLARCGVAYITLAHLFWRSVAPCVPIIPFMPERVYASLFPMPQQGLGELGRAAVRSMAEHGVMVDVTHMSRGAIEDTFRLLDEVDAARALPVIASHAMPRMGSLEYGLEDDVMREIAARGGVIGLPLSGRLLTDGCSLRPRTFDDTVEVLCAHIDRLARVVGSHRHTAVGSDLDGFVKPPPGVEDAAQLTALPRALGERYGDAVARDICVDNVLRVLRNAWAKPSSTETERGSVWP